MSPPTLSNSKRRRAEAACPVEMGEVVADKYVVEELIAAGGMGVVVSARHRVLGQTVAIKFLIPEAMEEQTISRFLREAKNAARIQSERVVRVYDCGTLPDGVPYMVMEHLDGDELAQVVRKRGRLPIEETVDLVAAALEGVAEAHKLGIVHRDLKPTNLFLVGGAHRPYSVKVLDFGISKIQPGPDTPVDDELTGTSMLLGSPRYISPEQARSSSTVDIRADIWSIGVILYEVLDGKCPFAGDTIGEVLSKILLHTPEPLQQRRSDMPHGLARVIERCLARDPDDRFPNVADLAHALAPYGSEHARLHAERIDSILGIERVKPAATAGDDALAAASAELAGSGLDIPDEADTVTHDSAAKEWAKAERALEEYRSRPTLPEVEPSEGEGQLTPPGVRTAGAWTHTEDRPRASNRRLVALLGAAALLVGGLLAWRFLGSEPPAPAEPTDTTAAPAANEPTPSETDSTTASAPPATTSVLTGEPGAAGGANAAADAGPAALSSQPAVRPPRPPVVRPVVPRPKPPSSDILDQSD